MDEERYLIHVLSEECIEVSKEAHKAVRFGTDDKDPTIEGAETQRERIAKEMDDLLGVHNMLVERGILRPPNPEAQRAKENKVTQFMEYSRNKGTLR
jgi:hypothetical protein